MPNDYSGHAGLVSSEMKILSSVIPPGRLLQFALLLTIAAVVGACAKPTLRPNVVLILTDDQGWADLGSYGASDLHTPNLDRLAMGGTRFTDFYSVAGSCSPSRAALLTGMYPQRVSIPGVLMPQSNRGLHPDERTLAEMLWDLGYATACFGKWHLGHAPQHLPTNHGFDAYFGIPYSNDMTPDSTKNPNPYARRHPPLPLVEGVTTVETEPDQTQLTRQYTERAIAFIEAHHDEPFFVYLPHTFPHMPLHVSDEFAGKTPRGLYGDVIMEIDWSTGRIMEAIERYGLAKKTLVIFTSDNGPWLIKSPYSGSAGMLREGKGTTFEGGHRVPTLMSWPGVIPAGQVSRIVASGLDIMPTIAAVTDAPPGPFSFDGRNLIPEVRGEASSVVPFFFYAGRQLQAVRAGQWKVHVPHRYRSIHGGMLATPTHPGAYRQDSIGLALFDLATDPAESVNLAGTYPDTVRHLMSLIDRMRVDLGDALTGVEGRAVRPPGRVE